MKILAERRRKQLFFKILICMGVSVLFTVGAFTVPGFKYASFAILAAPLFMALAILALGYGYFSEQDRIIENAAAQITEYIAGNPDVRIACDDEGELYKLFHKINSLAAVLNARAENELKSKEFLKNTISDISHQLKTPLAALNIYTGILQEESEDLPTIREFTNYSEQELDKIETLVQNLLKITRFDADTIVIDKTMESVPEMMKTIERHFAFRAGREKKKISLSGDADTALLCDRNWMIEAVDNIVKNALDHTKAGDTVQIEWKCFSSVVQIMIKDNGCGIHPEDLHHIFKRFYRSRFSQDVQGIGLGLPLAKAIIEAHNGTIEVDSELGAGARFAINFLQ